MKIIAVNGSQRKNWNTHILLEKCLEGAKEAGAEAELINLYDIQFYWLYQLFYLQVKRQFC